VANLKWEQMSDEERAKIERLVRAQTAPARLVSRARIIQLAAEGRRVPAIAQQLSLSENAVRLWITRFNTQGLRGLEDAPRSGRPCTYSEDARRQVIDKARSRPPAAPQGAEEPVVPTCHWTLDRLQAALAKDGLPIKRSQIRRILREERVKWQQPRTRLRATIPSSRKKEATGQADLHSSAA
jgi:transposase